VLRVPRAAAVTIAVAADFSTPFRMHPAFGQTKTTWGTAVRWPLFPAQPPVSVLVAVTTPFGVPAGSSVFPTFPESLLDDAVQIVVEVGAAPIPADPTTLEAAPPDPATGLRAAAPRRTGAAPASAVAAQVSSTHPTSTHPTVKRSQPRADKSARTTRRSSSHGPLPFERSGAPQIGGFSASSGGGASSLLVFGFATLTGSFVFAAPGLGRRIRLAREPSPRSRHDSPLDRPG
jgi:hypothetical protein